MRRIVKFILAALVLGGTLSAQVATGIYSMGSFSTQGFDTINLANLNTHFSIPVFSKSGRGGMNFFYNLAYDSAIWTPVNSDSTVAWEPATNWGWTVDTSALTGYFTYSSVPRKCFDDTPWYWSTIDSNFMYMDNAGTAHYFAGITSDCSSYGPSNTTLAAKDGSGYTLNAGVGSFTLQDSRGRSISPPVLTTSGTAILTDRNGNQITTTTSSIKDTTGTTVINVSGSGTASSPKIYAYPVWESSTSPTTSASVTVNYTSANILTNFGCSGVSEYSGSAVPLVSSVVLADGSTYAFAYESTPGHSGYVTGRLHTITLPTGGIITYSYSGGSNGIVCADGGSSSLTRTMTSISGTPTWTFTRTPGSSLNTTSTAVTDGLSPANSASYTFVSDPTDDPTNKYYQTSYVQNKGTSTQLLSSQTCYNGYSSGSCATQPLTVPITSAATTNTLDGASIDKQTYTYNADGNTTEEDDYDFVSSGNPATLIRKVVTGYVISPGLTGLFASQLVYDGVGHELSAYTLSFDGTSVTATSGFPQHTSGYSSRGNVTSVSILNSIPQASPTRHFTYDDTGQVLTATDYNGNSTSYSYDTGTNTYVIQSNMPTTGGVSHITKSAWDVGSGMKKSDTDQNNNTTNFTYDVLLRPTSITPPGSSSATATVTYNLSASVPNVYSTVLHASGSSTSTAYLDPYGRLQETDTTDSPHDDLTVYAYDGNGDLASVSNPYRTGDTPVYTTYAYDALGRNTKVTEPDSSQRTVVFSGNTQLTTDEASHKREIFADGIGRISKVLEPDSSNNLTLETDYAYVQNYTYSSSTGYSYQTVVQQKGGSSSSSQWRQRVFTYDQPGRVISELTPEGGTTSFVYSAGYSSGTGSYSILCSGNYSLPCTRTDANGTTTTYAYDALDRITGKTYSGSGTYSIGIASNTPTVSYSYDQASYNGLTIVNGVGQRTGMSDGTGQTAWSYDVLGRPTAAKKKLNGTTLEADFTYNPDGTINKLTDFNGIQFTYNYDGVGRQTGVTDSASGGHSYASSATYNAASQLTAMTHQYTSGSSIYNRTIGYNNRLQVSSIGATLGGSAIQSLGYVYGTGGTNNGNILSITNGTDSTHSRDQSYSYDNLNRLSQASDGTHWGEGYVYDNWGNMTQDNRLSSYSIGGNWQVAGTGVDGYNHFPSSMLQYDSAGQVIQDQFGDNFTYDAEGRLLTAGQGSVVGNYAYDGDGYRVKKTVGSNTTLYWPGAVGGVIDESDSTATHFGAQVQVAGVRVWSQLVSGTGYFLFQDHLGSTRVTGDASGNVKDDIDYLPFGGVAANYKAGSGNHYLFTGNESDGTESQTDYATFRNLSYSYARFNRPDPYDGSYDAMNPQSLNRYGYVLNNPLRFEDPIGLDCVYNNADGSVTYQDGDCEPDDNGFYIDASNVTLASFDENGDLNGYCVGGAGGTCYDGSGNSLSVDPGTPTYQGEGIGFTFNYSVYAASVFLSGAGATSGIGGGGRGGAPSNGKTLSSCVFNSEVGVKALQFGLDTFGAFPGLGNAGSALQFGAGVISSGISAATGDSKSAAAGYTGLGLTVVDHEVGSYVSLAVKGFKVLPVVGNVISGLSAANDAWGIGTSVYGCMTGAH